MFLFPSGPTRPEDAPVPEPQTVSPSDAADADRRRSQIQNWPARKASDARRRRHQRHSQVNVDNINSVALLSLWIIETSAWENPSRGYGGRAPS